MQEKINTRDILCVLPEVQPRNYYIYIHRYLSDNQVFYVGKGSGDRYKKFSNRSYMWKIAAYENGVQVEILHDNLSEEEAFALEIKLIKEYGRIWDGTGNLINIHEGGFYKPSYRKR